jgi:hypothetical protein
MLDQSEWGVWCGIEVEGRLTGVQTLFLHSLNSPNELAQVAKWCEETAHLYVCKEWLEQYGFVFVIEMHRANPQVLITLEIDVADVGSLPPELSATHCVVRLRYTSLDWLQALKPTDSVRLTGDFTTATVQAQHWLWSTRTQYAADELLIAVTKGQSRHAVGASA